MFVTMIFSLLKGNYVPGPFEWMDKVQHAVAFAGLGASGILGYPEIKTRIVISLLVYGAAIELIQTATGWRYGDWQDWLADAAGVGIALIGCVLWKSSTRLGSISTD